MNRPRMIYCAAAQKRIAGITAALGYDYGARLPDTVYRRPVFVDNDYKNPDLEGYIAALRLHRPDTATVIDWTPQIRRSVVIQWAESIAPFVETIIIIPKVIGTVKRIPRVIAGRKIILGFSVESTYGLTQVPPAEFGSRPVHLLGGSAKKQLDLGKLLNVVSLDINAFHIPAKYGRYYHGGRLPKGLETQWRYLSEDNMKGAKDGFYLAIEHSFRFYRQAWGYP